MNHSQPEFSLTEAHRFFAADCFNRAWDYLDQTQRTAEENEEMIHLTLASLWHWTQRGDCTELTLSIGYWQASRAYALAGRPAEAVRYAAKSLEYAEETTSFYRGYAHEGLARAYCASGDRTRFREHLKLAREEAAASEDPAEREALVADLAKLEQSAPA